MTPSTSSAIRGPGTRLGRAGMVRYPTFTDHLARSLRAAEPHATAERVVELEREAAQRATRQPAVYTDVTVSFSKSISVLHASIRENARRARLAGDERAGVLGRAGGQVPGGAAPGEPGRAGVPAQQWAGVTRTGYHGVRVDGQEPGRLRKRGWS